MFISRVFCPGLFKIFCHFIVDESTIMLIGGYQFENFEDSGYSGRTYNFRENAWTEGPTMKNVRGYFGCGSFNSNSHAGIFFVKSISS